MAINTESKTLAANGATLTGDQIVAAVEEILVGEGIGLFQLVARPFNFNGSTATYKLPEKIIGRVYARSTTGASTKGNGPVIAQVDITTTHEHIISVEFETMAFATQAMADAEKARIVNSMVVAINAQLDIEFLNELAKTTNTATVDLSKGDTQDKLATSRLKLGAEVAKIESTVSAHELGVSSKREIIILSPTAYWNYINSFDTNVREQSQEIKIGTLTISQINGAIVIKHPLVGVDLAAGDVHKTITSTQGTDKIEGFILTDVSLGMPINFIQTKARVNENFNEEIATKFKYGLGTLRSNLVVKLVMSA